MGKINETINMVNLVQYLMVIIINNYVIYVTVYLPDSNEVGYSTKLSIKQMDISHRYDKNIMS